MLAAYRRRNSTSGQDWKDLCLHDGESVPPMFLATETCIEFKKDTKIHLCDTCKRSSEFPECLNDGIEFGDGHGNDNIIVCDNYEQDGENDESNYIQKAEPI